MPKRASLLSSDLDLELDLPLPSHQQGAVSSRGRKVAGQHTAERLSIPVYSQASTCIS